MYQFTQTYTYTQARARARVYACVLRPVNVKRLLISGNPVDVAHRRRLPVVLHLSFKTHAHVFHDEKKV